MKTKEGAAGTDEITLARTGIAGLDEVLHGGLTAGSLCLAEGSAGTGKTTLALQFTLEGAKRGEAVLYVMLSETHSDSERIARSHGWDLEKVHIREAAALQAKPTTLFYPFEVELGEFMSRLKERIHQVGPARLVLDSLAEIRLMAEGALRMALRLRDKQRQVRDLLDERQGTQDALEKANEKLHAQADNLAAVNEQLLTEREELQQRAEELQRQSLELRRLKDEAEQTAHTTRDLSRSLEENPDPVLRVQPDSRIQYRNPSALPLSRQWETDDPQRVPPPVRQIVSAAYTRMEILRREMAFGGAPTR